MESFSKTCILIPSYNPDQNLVDLINDISKYSWKNIIIVDDGSNTETKYLFDEIKENFEVTVLSHKKNFGKGAALKTGFDYLKSNELNSIGVITVDADGQHLVKDIVEIANSAENEKKLSEDYFMGWIRFELLCIFPSQRLTNSRATSN